ncbi:hypothetical protein HAX54_019627, partial [Datura stramonium]|nr:hypothetical protein [Datura stramonium]
SGRCGGISPINKDRGRRDEDVFGRRWRATGGALQTEEKSGAAVGEEDEEEGDGCPFHRKQNCGAVVFPGVWSVSICFLVRKEGKENGATGFGVFQPSVVGINGENGDRKGSKVDRADESCD